MVSRAGWGNSRLAGGDFDGDLNMVSFDKDLVNFLERTQAAVDENPTAPIRKELEADEAWEKVPKTFPAGGDRCLLYAQYCAKVKTVCLRGRVCAMAERACFLFLREPTAESLHYFMRFASLAHMAMDAPKKYTVEAVLDFAKKMAEEGGLASTRPIDIGGAIDQVRES